MFKVLCDSHTFDGFEYVEESFQRFNSKIVVCVESSERVDFGAFCNLIGIPIPKFSHSNTELHCREVHAFMTQTLSQIRNALSSSISGSLPQASSITSPTSPIRIASKIPRSSYFSNSGFTPPSLAVLDSFELGNSTDSGVYPDFETLIPQRLIDEVDSPAASPQSSRKATYRKVCNDYLANPRQFRSVSGVAIKTLAAQLSSSAEETEILEESLLELATERKLLNHRQTRFRMRVPQFPQMATLPESIVAKIRLQVLEKLRDTDSIDNARQIILDSKAFQQIFHGESKHTALANKILEQFSELL